MNKTAREAVDFIEHILPFMQGSFTNVFLAVPYTSIAPSFQVARNSPIMIGSQNMHEEREGAFSGEIASLMLKEAGASFVLLGHSERRILFGENDARIRKKLIRALTDDLVPVLCVGETLEEKEAGSAHSILSSQLHSSLSSISKKDLCKVIIAYEPVWAIGTGKASTPEMAEETHAFIRSEIKKLSDGHTSQLVSILYGGSVQPNNAASLIEKNNIDGLLVGNASLDPVSFVSIIHQFKNEKVR